MRRRMLKDESGQSIVEFALVLPIVAILLFAIVEGGLMLNRYLTLTDAVRVGGRTASVSAGLGAADAQAATIQAMQQAAGGETLSSPTVSSDWVSGDPVTVSASIPYSIPILGISGTLTSTTVDRLE